MCVRVRVRACMSNRRGCICVYNLLNQKRDNVLTAVIVKEDYWAERTDMRPMRSLGVKALTHRQLVLLQFTLSTYCHLELVLEGRQVIEERRGRSVFRRFTDSYYAGKSA